MTKEEKKYSWPITPPGQKPKPRPLVDPTEVYKKHEDEIIHLYQLGFTLNQINKAVRNSGYNQGNLSDFITQLINAGKVPPRTYTAQRKLNKQNSLEGRTAEKALENFRSTVNKNRGDQ